MGLYLGSFTTIRDNVIQLHYVVALQDVGSRARLAKPNHKAHRVSRGSQGLIIGLAGARSGSWLSQRPIGTNHRILQGLIGSLKGSQAPIIGSDDRDL